MQITAGGVRDDGCNLFNTSTKWNVHIPPAPPRCRTPQGPLPAHGPWLGSPYTSPPCPFPRCSRIPHHLYPPPTRRSSNRLSPETSLLPAPRTTEKCYRCPPRDSLPRSSPHRSRHHGRLEVHPVGVTPGPAPAPASATMTCGPQTAAPPGPELPPSTQAAAVWVASLSPPPPAAPVPFPIPFLLPFPPPQ